MLNTKTLCAAFLYLFGAGVAFCQVPAPPPNVFHDYNYTFFTLPNGTGTLTAINNLDVVAGSYYPNTPPVFAMGYLRCPDGRVVTFSVPNATSVTVNELNDRGELVGVYQDSTTGNDAGFIRHAGGKIETFALNGAAGYTAPTGINIEGQVVGFLSTSNTGTPTLPFLRYRDGQYLTFGVEDSTTIFTRNINDAGIALGSYFCSASQGGVCGFYGKPGGKLTTFSYPPNGLVPFEINNRNVVAGVVDTASGSEDYFIRKPDGKLILFGLTQVDTDNCSINDEDEVIGDYSVYVPGPPPSGGTEYRYDIVRTPDGKIGNYDPPSSPGSLQGDAINDRGVIAGRLIAGFGGTSGLFLLTPKH